MTFAARFAIAGLPIVALVLALGSGVALRAQEAAHATLTEIEHSCLNQKERRAEAETTKLVRLDAAMHTARGRMPGTWCARGYATVPTGWSMC